MKLRLLVCSLVVLLSANLVFAQNSLDDNGISSIKPLDGKVILFSHLADLEAVAPKRITELKGDIQIANNDPETAIQLREMLWRWENARVITDSDFQLDTLNLENRVNSNPDTGISLDVPNTIWGNPSVDPQSYDERKKIWMETSRKSSKKVRK